MPALELSVEVPAPPAAVWAAAVDWDRQHEWVLGTRVRAVAEGGRGAGARIEAFTGIGRLGFLDPMTITRWDPPRRCDVLHTGRVVRGTGTFAVAPSRAGSRFTWREDVEVPLGALGRIGWLLVRPLVAAGVRRSLRRFAAWAPYAGS